MKIKGYFAKTVAAGFALLLVCFAAAPVCYADEIVVESSSSSVGSSSGDSSSGDSSSEDSPSEDSPFDIFELHVPRPEDQNFDVFFTWQGSEPPLPETVIAVVDKSTKDEYIFEEVPIEIEWDLLSGFDCNKVGNYKLTGTAPSSELVRLNLTNVNNKKAVTLVSVRKKGAIDSLHGRFISKEGAGEHRIRPYLPVLPRDAKAVYLYVKTQSTEWARALNPDGEENFLDWEWPNIELPGTEQNFRYDYTPQTLEPITLRMEVVGSENAGDTNELTLWPPGYVPPPDNGDDGGKDDSDTGDAGDSGGNRGGGGQTEEEREPPKKLAAASEPVKVEPPQSASAPPAAEPAPARTESAPSDSSPRESSEASEPEEPKESFASSAGSGETADVFEPVAPLAGGVQTVPPAREQRNSIPPAAAAASVLAGGAGLGGWIFLKKRH